MRKVLSVILCCVMAAGLLQGCTDGQPPATESSQQESDATVGITAEAAAPEPIGLAFDTQYIEGTIGSQILIFRTAEELEAHTARIMGSGSESESEKDARYSNIVKAYDEDFFVTNTLILIPMTVGSSSYCVKATNVTLADKKLVVEVDELVSAPGYAFTEMIGAWTLFVAVNAVFEDDVTVECQVTDRPVTGEFLQYLHKKIRGE